MDMGIVDEYAESMRLGDGFPPVSVCFDGTDRWLLDGFHRVYAARKAGLTSIQAKVWKGNRDDALWMSLAANKAHGLRRTNEDKVRAVTVALAAKPQRSDSAIAEHVGVSHTMVAKYRQELPATCTGCKSEVRTGRDGRTIHTANIGKAVRTQSEPSSDADATNGENHTDLRPTLDGPKMSTDGGAQQPGEVVRRVTDQLGHVVKGKVAEAFRRRRRDVQACILAISQVESLVLGATEDKALPVVDVNATQFRADCESLLDQLKAALPFAACPHCRAVGCKACQDRGWISESAWQAAPEELRARSSGHAKLPQQPAPLRRGARPARGRSRKPAARVGS